MGQRFPIDKVGRDVMMRFKQAVGRRDAPRCMGRPRQVATGFKDSSSMVGVLQFNRLISEVVVNERTVKLRDFVAIKHAWSAKRGKILWPVTLW